MKLNDEDGFPHSEICGSKVAHTSPQLIAACHVLHRLCMPRHPPNALTSRLRVHTTNDSAERPGRKPEATRQNAGAVWCGYNLSLLIRPTLQSRSSTTPSRHRFKTHSQCQRGTAN